MRSKSTSRRFPIEPFLRVGGELLTWADAKQVSQSLAEGFAPVPTVTREYDGLKLSVTAAADGEVGRSSLILLYTLTNTSEASTPGSLILAARPFQVNPPYQWLNASGGVARIEQIEFDESGRMLEVDGRLVAFGAAPDEFGAAGFDEGDVVRIARDDKMGRKRELQDAAKAASAAVKYEFQLAAGESESWAVCVPFARESAVQQELLEPFVSAADPVENVRDVRMR